MAEPARPAAAPEYPPLRGGKLLFLTAAIATASFMEILDMTIVNVSVPAISGSLGQTAVYRAGCRRSSLIERCDTV
jgi:hypothetical protein